MSCVPFASPLDLQCVFVNIFSGSFVIFSLILIILVVIMAARFRMPNIIIGASLFLLAVMFRTEMPWLSVILAVGGGITIAIQLARGWGQ